jgi:replicative DNA helicase
MSDEPRFEDAARKKADIGDKLPPHAIEAEKGLLGCALNDPVPVLSALQERGVDLSWFYDLGHQLLWWAMADAYSRGQAVDVVTVWQWVCDSGQADKFPNGLACLAALPEATPSAANWPAYADILEDKWRQRQLLALGVRIQMMVQAEKANTALILSEAERGVMSLSEDAAAGVEKTAASYVERVYGEIKNYRRGHAQIKGLTTGLEYLDKLLCGFGGKHGNYVVVSSRPGLGKTALATDIMLHVAFDHVWWEPQFYPDGKPKLNEANEQLWESRRGLPVAFFSMEMKAEALVERMIFQRAGVDMQTYRTGFARKDDQKRMDVAADEILGAGDRLLIDDEARCTIETIKARARRLARQKGIKLFIVDYIQLLRSERQQRKPDRVHELTEISGEIQALGKELNVPFLVLAQMNRDYEKDPLRTPRLADLKDCGAIEQDADVVIFLYEPKQSKEERESIADAIDDGANREAEAKGERRRSGWSGRYFQVNALVAKARYGPSGKKVQLLFENACTKWHDYNVWLKQRGVKSAAAGERGYEERPEEP